MGCHIYPGGSVLLAADSLTATQAVQYTGPHGSMKAASCAIPNTCVLCYSLTFPVEAVGYLKVRAMFGCAAPHQTHKL